MERSIYVAGPVLNTQPNRSYSLLLKLLYRYLETEAELAKWGKWENGVSPHFLHKDTSDARGVHYILTVRRLGRTLPASTCASERADIAVARSERVLGSRRAAPKFNLEKLL